MAALRRATRGAGPAVEVSLVVEQLRRTVPGGIGTYCWGLLAGLGTLVAEGTAVPTMELVASATRERPDPLASWGLPVHAVGLPGPILTRSWDRGSTAGVRGSVVHASSLAAPSGRGRALVVTVHDLGWRQVPDAYPRRGRRWHEAAFGRARAQARRLVVPSVSVADAVVAAGVDAARVVVVEHGGDHLPPPDPGATEALLHRLGVTGSFMLAVGTLEPRKNLVRLVEAHRRAQDRLPEPCPLVVVGPSGWGDAVPAGGAVLAGAVPAPVLAGLYGRACLLAYVPLLEGFGLPPLEAMSAGTPVVSSPVPSTGGAALEVDPTDVDAIAGALVTVATDGRARQDLVAAGRRRAAARTWRASAEEHLALWASLR